MGAMTGIIPRLSRGGGTSSLSLVAREEGIDLHLWEDGSTDKPPLVMAVDVAALADRRSSFLAALTDWTSAAANNSDGIPDAVDALREAGRGLFETIATDSAGFLAFAGSAANERVVLSNSLPELEFPWALLHTGEKWLGEIAIFSRAADRGAVERRTEAADRDGSRAGYAEDSLLASSIGLGATEHDREIEAVRTYFGSGCVDFLPPLEQGAMSGRAASEFGNWLAQPRSITHFNTTADNDAGPGEKTFRLRNRARASASNLAAGANVRAPVFLNLCEVDEGSYRELRDTFRERRVPGLCFTAGYVSDQFATLFARTFYSLAARNGHALLPTLRATQRKTLDETGNLMALQYMYEGDPTQVIKR